MAEGEKLIVELIAAGLKPQNIYMLEGYVHHTSILNNPTTLVISEMEMGRISNLTTPASTLAVFHMPRYHLNSDEIKEQLVIALDGIQDPGNLGTIIRLCVWFGVTNLVCSTETVDCYNPKVVQASMGALAKVKIHYTNLSDLLEIMQSSGIPIFGTFLEGKNLYQSHLPKSGIIVMGNEGNGISKNVENMISNKITIPAFTNDQAGAESLNVATATAIILSEFRRNGFTD